MTTLDADLTALIGPASVAGPGAISEDYAHDESLGVPPTMPDVLVRPDSTAAVAAILAYADRERIPVTARGAGSGLSGGAIAKAGGILLSTERLDRIVEIDTANHVAVVQPGVTLDQLEAVLAPHGLVYPIMPGEPSATLGGNAATNAGGMRAVKYGVTRHQVLGLEAVLAGGETIRTGGKYVKATTGFDLTQLLVGSEGTLAVITELTLKVQPRLAHQATVLVPFATLESVTTAVPVVVASGIGPLMLEYIDLLTMESMINAGLELAVPDDVRRSSLAYLMVLLESKTNDRLEADTAELAERLFELGATDVYVLPPAQGDELLHARERAFWNAKAMGVDDIVDVVVPRASIPEYVDTVGELATRYEALVGGAGHAGDGNVHLAVFQPDEAKRRALMRELLSVGMELGGTISAEHGIGAEKRSYYLDLEDPTKLRLQRAIKAAFDPNGILNPGTLLD